jgi:hypothetical protein
MAQYIDIILTLDGYFCVAPAWVVKEGDLISLQDALSGKSEIHEVVSVATDSTDGDFIKLIEKFTGNPLPRVKGKYQKCEVLFDEPVQE